jgi:hypothetical protein
MRGFKVVETEAVSEYQVRHILKGGFFGHSRFLMNLCPNEGNHLILSPLLVSCSSHE